MPALWVVPEELEEGSGSPYAYEACKAASYILWAFSGRKYHGTRTVTERYEMPCRSANLPSFNVYPRLDGAGAVRNELEPATCGCSGVLNGRHTRLRLRGAPVRHVTRVSKSGVDLDPSEYKIVNGSVLQLTGSQSADGLEVTYTYGVNVPTSGQRSARLLARELVKGWSGEECLLPDRVTNVTREGISFTIMDKQDFLDEGRTGIYEVDLFLRAANPDKARKPARIFSPDKAKAIRVTAGEVSQVVGPLDWKITPGKPADWTVNLSGNNADILADSSWNPRGQISTWNGAIVLEFDTDRFEIVNDMLLVHLTGDETAQITGSTALWDLYGVSAVDGYTLIHVLSSTIYLTGDA